MSRITKDEQIALLRNRLNVEKHRADQNYLAFENVVEKLERANAKVMAQAQRIAALEEGLAFAQSKHHTFVLVTIYLAHLDSLHIGKQIQVFTY